VSRGLLLAQDVGEVVGAEGARRGSLLDGSGYGFRSVLADQFQDLAQLPRQGPVGIRHVAQIGFEHGLGTQVFQGREETLLGSRPLGRGTQVGQFRFEAAGAESLPATPAARIGDDFVNAVVDGDRGRVRLEGEAAADKARGHAVTVAVEVQTVIFVDKSFDGIAMVIGDHRQGPQGLGLEPIDGAFSRFAVHPLMGDFGKPLPGLAVHVVPIRELPQGPEGLTCIPDGALDLPFFPAGRRVAGFRKKAILAGEGQQARQKADQTAIVFGDGGGQIVVGDFSGDAAHRGEGVHVTAGEGFEALAVRELQVQHPAMCFHQREGIQLAFVAGVIEGAEMAPIDLEALARWRLHPQEGARRLPRRAGGAHVLAQDGVGASVTEKAESLFDDGGRGGGIFLQPFGDGGLKRIKLAWALAGGG